LGGTTSIDEREISDLGISGSRDLKLKRSRSKGAGDKPVIDWPVREAEVTAVTSVVKYDAGQRGVQVQKSRSTSTTKGRTKDFGTWPERQHVVVI